MNIRKNTTTLSHKKNKSIIMAICVIPLFLLLSLHSHAAVVFPEVRAVVPISKTDINRITCGYDRITSINYAGGTGLIHKTDENRKNIVILFQQLDNGIERRIIDSSVNVLISCGSDYYSLVLEPQDIDTQTIRLTLSAAELETQSNLKKLKNSSTEQRIIDLIKTMRSSGGINPNRDIENKDIFINNLTLKLINIKDIRGSAHQIKKFVVLSNQPQRLTEKMFLHSEISKYRIDALSLDEHELTAEKNFTFLYVVLNKGY